MVDVYICRKVIRKIPLSELHRYLSNKSYSIWVDITDTESAEFNQIVKLFNIHHLVVEDLKSTNQPAKIEQFDDWTYIVMYGIRDNNTLYHDIQLNFIFGKNFTISIHKESNDAYGELKKEETRLHATLNKGSAFMLHNLIDTEVNHYFPAIDVLEDKIEEIEAKVLAGRQENFTPTLFELKRQLLALRKQLTSFRDIFNNFVHPGYKFIPASATVFFRDLYDHILQLNSLADTQKETILSIIEVQLSIVSNRTNDVMKFLTIIATILLPMTAIGAVYGMNFKYMPELEYEYGYFIVMGIIAAVTITMLIYFKKKKWV